jgi:hypothetical protein
MSVTASVRENSERESVAQRGRIRRFIAALLELKSADDSWTAGDHAATGNNGELVKPFVHRSRDEQFGLAVEAQIRAAASAHPAEYAAALSAHCERHGLSARDFPPAG